MNFGKPSAYITRLPHESLVSALTHLRNSERAWSHEETVVRIPLATDLWLCALPALLQSAFPSSMHTPAVVVKAIAQGFRWPSLSYPSRS